MEAALKERRASPARSAASTGKATLLGKLDSAASAERRPTGSSELDRVVGGGLVPGSVVLLGGDPGIGKSTLLLQVGARVCADASVLYATGEESASQVAARAGRLGLDVTNLQLMSEPSLDVILEAARDSKAALLIVD